MKLLVIILGVVCCTAGTIADNAKATFYNPIKDDTWPDPYCYLHSDGFYYMPRKEDETLIVLYKSSILHDWRNAESSIIYESPPGKANLWAPEIHFIWDNFYIYFALDDGDNANHRMYVIRAENSSDPMGAWTTEKEMIPPGDHFWAIDGTVLQYGNGQLYFIWSGWPTIDAGFPQNLYIAPMSDPETFSGPRVLIKEPTYDWEQQGAPIIEGPQILHNAGRVFVVYSCSASWQVDYKLGFMGIDDLRDPLDFNNWWRHDQPVFWRNDDEGVYGVGHASFTTSKDGTEPWIVYHAMDTLEGGWEHRTARVQMFGWNPDNSPAFPRPLGFDTPLETPSGEE